MPAGTVVTWRNEDDERHRVRSREGPVEFEFSVEIGSPASEVFPLIDWADPRNAKRQLGNTVEQLEGQSDRFEMVLNGLPDHRQG